MSDQPEPGTGTPGTVLGVKLPDGRSLTSQIGMVERLAEALYAGARHLREAELHLTAAELEAAALHLVAAADHHRDLMRVRP